MNFSDSVKDFIAAKQEASAQVQGYEKDLNIFWTFLETEKVSESTWRHVLGGANTDLIIKSLKYYVDHSKVTSMSTANRFISVFTEYFQYAYEKKHFSNKELYEEMHAPIYSDRSYRARINTWISKNLKDKESTRVFNEVEIQELIGLCNDTLKVESMDDEYFDKKFVPALIIKLIILTGIKYKLIPKLKLADVNLRYGTLTINNYEIHLPHMLIDQFELYSSLRNKRTESNILFIKSNGEQLAEITGFTATFLGSLTSRTDIQGIIRFVIIEMMKKGITIDIIKEFTGVGNTIINDCLQIINKDLHMERKIFLDSTLRALKTFKYL
ncbi:hypothetical protein [Cohnella thailandensis]|uniref:Uncharacterized protein n=1 Tax=Cohnella thailandensis TaxID=557557 RepID=A0A841SWG2_9BACL|nr:hypothetical protein [Cohnella thailandensis]MBB6635299.1 hypothetical protein [Cohnella thailandensis]MBP1974677.1 site-specific recombinase XerD [Cohnella thailandensis]